MEETMSGRFIFGIAAILLLAVARPAAADSIDGNWCSTDGRHFEIEGPLIVTWGGSRVAGDYDRHGFRYVVPGTEKEAGSKIDMRLLGEYRVLVSKDGGAPETFNRCAKPTS
jgi:hypothetical protein